MNDHRLKDLVVGPGGNLFAISDSGALFKTNTPVVAIGDLQLPVPSTYELDQNYPNPFNPTTIITYGLPRQSGAAGSELHSLGCTEAGKR